MLTQDPIGYLKPHGSGYVAVCADHRDQGGRNTPLYRVNVEPYGQTCYVCAKVLVQAKLGWCELYTTGDARRRV